MRFEKVTHNGTKIGVVCAVCSNSQEIDPSEFAALSFPMSKKKAEHYVKVIIEHLKKKEVVCDGCGTISCVAPNDREKLERGLKEALLSKK